MRAALIKIWRRHTFPEINRVSSAQVGLTSLFGMGRGEHHRNSHHNILNMNKTIMERKYNNKFN